MHRGAWGSHPSNPTAKLQFLNFLFSVHPAGFSALGLLLISAFYLAIMGKALANAAEALGKNLSSLLGKAAALPRVSSGSASMCRAVDGCVWVGWEAMG